MNVKQIIVVRTDLKMPPGKVAAQVAHASLGAMLTLFRKYTTSDNTTRIETEFGSDSVMDKWLNGIFTKVILGIESKDALEELEANIQLEFPTALITDAGLTVFKEPTITCLGIGPCISSEIDKYTKHLKLFK